MRTCSNYVRTLPVVRCQPSILETVALWSTIVWSGYSLISFIRRI